MPKIRWRKTLLILCCLLLALALGVCLFLKTPRFGALPDEKSLELIKTSPHYSHGEFQNTLPTPMFAEDNGFISTLLQFLLTKRDNPVPPAPVPTVKTALKTLDPSTDIVVWLGHSSFFIQLGGQRILIDPVLSDYAAPISLSTRAFPGSNPYTAEDLPAIDVLLISHDHWDHLDYPTLLALRPKIGRIVCGLGVGSHLRRWGFADDRIYEGDWGDKLSLGTLTIHITAARHFSGRALTRNKSLWAGFVVESPVRRIFFSGDSGYGPHFAALGEEFGTFDLALLECGQYDTRWSLIHMSPEETARAADDLNAKALLPAHGGKFSIAYHSWDDPYKRIAAASQGKNWILTTPMIGEPLFIESLPKESASFTTIGADGIKGANEQRIPATRWWQHIQK